MITPVFLFSSVLLFYVITVTDSTVIEEISVGNGSVTDERHNVGKYSIYEIVWNNERIPGYCKFKFIETSNDARTICVRAIEYKIKDCNIKLSYYFGNKLTPDKEFSCGVRPPEECAGKGEDFVVELSEKIPTSSTYMNSSLTLLVSSEGEYETSDYFGTIGGIIAGVIGGIILFVVVIVIIVTLVCNQQHRRRSRISYHAGVQNHFVMTPHTQSGIQTTNVTNASQPNTKQYPTQPYTIQTYPPQPYPSQQYPAQMYTQQGDLPPPYSDKQQCHQIQGDPDHTINQHTPPDETKT